MSASIEERVATLEARTANIDGWLEKLDQKQDQILASVNRAKGAWFALLGIVGLAGTLGALLRGYFGAGS